MSDSNITLTKGQQEAVAGLVEFFDQPYDENRMIYGLTGRPGVGKSFTLKYVIDNCKLARSLILSTAPTHKACRVLSDFIKSDSKTIHSVFGFRPNINLEDFDYNNPLFQPIGKLHLDNAKVLIIDEASMLNANLVRYIINICKSKKVKILMVGDSRQMSPVNEKLSTAFTVCYKMYELTEVVRQDNDNPLQTLLDMIKKDIDNKTLDSISFLISNRHPVYNGKGDGFSVVRQAQFKQIILEKFSDKEFTKDIAKYKIIAYTNARVAYWNQTVREKIVPDWKDNFLTGNDLIMSYNTILDQFMEPIICNSEEYIVKDIVDYSDDKYGFYGYLVKFQLVYGGTITKPLFIIDHTNSDTITKYVSVCNKLLNEAKTADDGSRARKWKEYYKFKENYLLATNINSNGKILYSRDIDYAFAITSNRSQGSTYDNVFVDLNNICFTNTGMIQPNKDEMLRRLYVAISRARHEAIISYK